MAYVDADDLWLYDVARDASRRLTENGDARGEASPAFVNGGCLAYASSQPASVNVVDLTDGTTRPVVEEVGYVRSLDVSPDGSTLLYLLIDYDVDATFRLKRVPVAGGDPTVVHTFHPSLGRGGSSEDDVSVAWSPDGSMILAANTHEAADEFAFGAIYLFDAGTADVVRRWRGTHPAWSPDGQTIYYRGHAGYGGQRWHALDVKSMSSRTLGLRPGTNWLEVAPDGKRVTYDTSWFGDMPSGVLAADEAPNVYTYALATGTETLLRRGALGALWVSDIEVVVTDAAGPEGWNSWRPLGTVSRIAVSGERAPVDMTSTLFDADVYLPR